MFLLQQVHMAGNSIVPIGLAGVHLSFLKDGSLHRTNLLRVGDAELASIM